MAERIKMSVADRAKQFLPFSPLKGYDEMIASLDEEVAERAVLTEEQADILSERVKSIKKGDMVRVKYYTDGKYVTARGMVSAIDLTLRSITVVKNKIGFDDLYELFIEEL